jgi:nitrate/nitrite-specific signal transduction histidine kinase
MNKITTLLFLLCSTVIALQAAPNMSIYEAINKAGYQRMLTQRIAKCYVSIIANIEPEINKKHLKGSAKTFESNLRELKSYAPTEEIRDQFRYVEILWNKYKFVYDDYYSKDNANKILEYNNKILEACHKAVGMLEAHAIESKLYGDQELRTGDKELAHIINLSGRQRMLTQRIALYAIAKAYQLGNAVDNEQYYTTAVIEFSTAYDLLQAYSKNTDEIQAEYANVGEHWSVLSEEMKEVVAATEITDELNERAIEALKNADLLLFSFDEIVFLYERLKD